MGALLHLLLLRRLAVGQLRAGGTIGRDQFDLAVRALHFFPSLNVAPVVDPANACECVRFP